MTAAAPSGVVTFLFTDIEGSTRRWEADADSMWAALLAHDKVLRAAIEAHGGWLFKHTGDGVCAAFASPKSAVDAAVVAQRGLQLPVMTCNVSTRLSPIPPSSLASPPSRHGVSCRGDRRAGARAVLTACGLTPDNSAVQCFQYLIADELRSAQAKYADASER
jgi:class 3 adenylate cyclase